MILQIRLLAVRALRLKQRRIAACNTFHTAAGTFTLQSSVDHVGSHSHSVTCHPAEVTFPPFPQPKPILD